MSKFIGKYFFIFAILILFPKCVGLKNNTHNFAKIASPCDYTFEDISDIRVDNILFNDKNSVALALLPKVNSLLSNVSDTTMLEYSINLNLSNKTTDTLFLKQLNYSLYIDKRIVDQGTIEDSIIILPYKKEKYSLLIQSQTSNYRNIFKDSQELSNVLKGLIGLNNQVVNSSLELDSIVYVIKGKECIDEYVKNIKF